MSLTYTVQEGIGEKAPDFNLLDVVTGKERDFASVRGLNGTVVMFICNHCPYVVHVREQLIALANEYATKGIGFVAISSNDISGYPQDGPVKMKQLAETLKFPFPYVYDESQEVAKAYAASCTPDFMVFDAADLCVYRGRLDGSSPGNGVPCDGGDMRQALSQMLDGKAPLAQQKPSMGCNIKWIPGNEPAYFG